MRPLHTSLARFFALASTILCLLPLADATRLIQSTSLDPCQENSHFTASLFNVVFTPNNNTLTFDIVGVSDISGNVTADIIVIAYGYTALTQTLNPCDSSDLKGLCPMNTGQLNIQSNVKIDPSAVAKIPGIAYTVPDLDGKVQVYINKTDTGEPVACVEAELSNGKTVYQKAVGWCTAVIAGLALLISAITSGLGHSNTAAHVASNALSLFGYFQAQAFIGLTAVSLPPIVASWTQNFQWSMGIIRVGFLQDICTWYQRSTGGTSSQILSNLATTSVQVQKRSLDVVHRLFMRAYSTHLENRSNAKGGTTNAGQPVIVRGVQRVGFRAGIEPTNIFMTGYIFFIIFIFAVIIGVVAFKGVCELLVKQGRLRNNKFQDFRHGWKLVLKGILYRIILIGFPQMTVLCLWEFTVRDSGGEVVLALFTLVTMIGILGWAASKVIRIARRSIAMHKNPAYILYSDPVALNKWGFLYVQFKATAYYFIVPLLGYIFLKGLFVGVAQGNGIVQAIALVLLEAGLLIAVSILRPYMDRKVNGFNIAIAATNFLSAIFLLVFTQVFNQPGIVTGVMGVIFFIFNAVFAFVLLLMVLVASVYAITSKNPDTRYQPMRDDRGSFIKSQTQLTTELDALGQTARGDRNSALLAAGPGAAGSTAYYGAAAAAKEAGTRVALAPNDADDDSDDDASLSSDSLARAKHETGLGYGGYGAAYGGGGGGGYGNGAGGGGAYAYAPPAASLAPHSPGLQHAASFDAFRPSPEPRRHVHPSPSDPRLGNRSSPAYAPPDARSPTMSSDPTPAGWTRAPRSPWHRGAGYE